MIIAIPVEKRVQDTPISPSFGRTPLYMIYDSNGESCRFLDNSAMNASGGAGIKAAQLLVDEGIEALIVPQCGQNAAEVLSGAEIKVYKASGGHISDDIQELLEGSLPLLNEFHAGFHGHRGGR